MNFLPNSLIATSWSNLASSKVENKFIGLLYLLRNIFQDSRKGKVPVIPLKKYTISTINLSNSLQKTFYFGENEKKYIDTDNYFCWFANNWQKTAIDNFVRNEINIFDIAVVCLNDFDFNTEKITNENIVKTFLDTFNIDDETKKIWFPNEIYNKGLEPILGNVQNRKFLKNDILNKINLSYGNGETLGVEAFTPKSSITIEANPGELSRAPFFQTLYANQTAMKCLICSKFDVFTYYGINEPLKKVNFKVTAKLSSQPRQKILFGAPGTGKSHKIKQLRKEFGAKEFKTVFHPDSDYTSFVGAYKPMMKGDDVRYAFVPQVFTKAYTYAWNNPDELVLLTIEEINRGNCAQIFGDLFQCLDRNASGASEYAIDAEYDLAEYLKENLENQDIIQSVFEENYHAEDCFSKIALPQNLLIYATMNTSDQSLFPMDSAFKRRWDWEYVPINYEKANEMTIQLDETTAYNWGDFIKRINEKIYEITQSEDKQLGNYFVKTNDNQPISLDIFRSKVMFYLWSEIFKEENEADTIFKYSENGEHKAFTFNQLYNENAAEILKSFMAYNEIETLP
jgi:hypothetical protein